MTEVERIQATIARITAKRDAASDPQSAMYYKLCIAGWRAELKRARGGAKATSDP